MSKTCQVLFFKLFLLCHLSFLMAGNQYDLQNSTSSQHILTLTARQECDLEMLLMGAFSPLKGFLEKEDYLGVVNNCRLKNGKVWPMPIVLDVSEQFGQTLRKGDELALKDRTGKTLAKMVISSKWRPDKRIEAQKVFATQNIDHPGVDYLFNQTKPIYIGGEVKKIDLPNHGDFTDLRKTPKQMRKWFKENGINKIVAFQTRNPMHRAHVEITNRAREMHDAHLLINPIVGLTKPGDVDPYTRVRCYRKILKRYPEDSASLCVLPLAMRMAGPREALWHALIRKNYGCTHFIVGRDHAGPGKDRFGNDFYGPYDAQKLVNQFADEIGIEMVPFQMMVYLEESNKYVPINEVSESEKYNMISGTELRRCLKTGEFIPEWFSYPEVLKELRKNYPRRNEKGFTVFFTGLSGAGKSTIAKALSERLKEIQYRSVSVLDGDVIRTHLSSELGFSAKDRSTNVRRVGYVASEITKSGGIAICALIAPYEADRKFNSEIIKAVGGYIETYVSTPLEICEKRDVKGLYEKVRSGLITNFTGIDDPYETPERSDLVFDTTDKEVKEVVESIVDFLTREGYLNQTAI